MTERSYISYLLSKNGKWPFLLLLAILGTVVLSAQNAAKRYEIDAKRMDVSPTDKDALPRGREFVRLDSTYYVGWMYQGLFLYDRSADQSGFQKALPYLRNGFILLDKDFTPTLQTIYNSPNLYIQNNTIYRDYLELARTLRDSYEYLEMPDSAIWVIRQLEQKNFKRDESGLLFGTKAWIIHRNRYYTNKEYGFLKETVAENEELALQTCYNGFAFIQKNLGVIDGWFGSFQAQLDHQFIHHYLAMIHSYMQQYDSSEYYYNKMAEFGSISWNNYGSLKHELGQFSTATQLYQLDQYSYQSDKRLMEPFYYLPMLSVYAGKTREAMATAQEAITQSQSSPGFGWYNIALARAYLYNGQLDSANITLSKANNFKEVHIGTTLTQPQYAFTINLLRQVWYKKKMAAIKFEDRGWWYKPTKWYALAKLNTQKYLHQYALATQLAANPERQRMIYDLFCGESTVSFDEIFEIMETFSPRFFAGIMEEKATADPRENIKRYFRLTEARLLVERGKTDEAKTLLLDLYKNTDIDAPYEKLFTARVLEMLADISKATEQQGYLNQMLSVYPQLIPFSGNTLKMGLQISTSGDPVLTKIREALHKTAIDFTDDITQQIPVASIQFKKTGIKYEATIDVRSADNKTIVRQEKFLFQKAEGVANEIALRIFGKNGTLELEQ